MRVRRKTFIAVVLCTFLLTGCWDRTELNDIAIELAWGIDQAQGHNIELSAQIIIPSKLSGGFQGGGGGRGKSFFVKSAIGRDSLDAAQKMQAKLSRKLFRGHRRVIVIGEAMARAGLKDILDTYTRDPQVRWRTDLLVVKGMTGKDFLQISYPLENVAAIGALKEHEQMGVEGQVALLNFLMAATSDGRRPTLPAIAISTDGQTQETANEESKNEENAGFQIIGTAVFDKNLKMVGYLNLPEKLIYHWIRGELNKQIITGHLAKESETFSLDLSKMSSKIKTKITGNKIRIHVILNGSGQIRENNTKLDLTQSKNLDIMQNDLEKETNRFALKTIKKVQSKFGTDIFGFGEAVHRQYPYRWQSLKKKWDKEFLQIDVTVTTNLTIERVGLTGPSVHLREDEIKK